MKGQADSRRRIAHEALAARDKRGALAALRRIRSGNESDFDRNLGSGGAPMDKVIKLADAEQWDAAERALREIEPMRGTV